jgi:hypothetical protein
MVELYFKTIKEHLLKVVASNQRDWDEKLPLFLLAYRASTHDTTGLTPASLVFGRELRLPCDLLFGVPPVKERPTTDYAAELVDWPYDIHNYARQNLKLASDRMKTRYDKLANSAGYQEGDSVALSSNLHERKIAKTTILVGRPIQDSHPHKRCGIQNPRSRMMVVHLTDLHLIRVSLETSAPKEGAKGSGWRAAATERKKKV